MKWLTRLGAGKYAGAVSYSYTKGPDGKLYITGGEVSLDIREESEPEETIKKMEVIISEASPPPRPIPSGYKGCPSCCNKKNESPIELSQKEADKTSGTFIDILA